MSHDVNFSHNTLFHMVCHHLEKFKCYESQKSMILSTNQFHINWKKKDILLKKKSTSCYIDYNHKTMMSCWCSLSLFSDLCDKIVIDAIIKKSGKKHNVL